MLSAIVEEKESAKAKVQQLQDTPILNCFHHSG
jgi:hypothetical protein